ncbi:hypothetical protein [Kiloniella antarctica]|uniref:Uncharacterized protein n=1 Tax=Kiloniella antarctica TaxID=1550907 RepID=A0ABW5BFJ3_9PROT
MSTLTTDIGHTETFSHTKLNDDPKSIIHQMVMIDSCKRTPAEDAILAWILSLPNELDPASAAKRLLDKYEDLAVKSNEGAIKTLGFLKQTAEYPQSRLSNCRRKTRSQRRYHN